MPTLEKTITDSNWTNLVTEFSLLPGEKHMIQNFGPGDLLLTEQAISPTDPVNDTPRILVYPGNDFEFTVNPGFSFFARCKFGGTAAIYIQRIGGAINRFLLNRPLSRTGLPPVGAPSSDDVLITGIGSLAAPIDYYIEALPGERLAVARVMIQIVAASQSIEPGEYGDLPALINGIMLLYRVGGLTLNVVDGLLLKTNEDWGRWSFDSGPVRVGVTNKTPYWQARWTFTKYGSDTGIMLEEGDRLAIRLRDDLSLLSEQTVIAEGVHYGIPSPDWLMPV